MNRIAILVIEDEPEVREAIARDLDDFADHFPVELAEDVKDARAVMDELRTGGDRVGLALCDHLLPGERGVDFLVELNESPDTRPVRKVLITGQAGLEDTIRAVNEADLDHYIAKPWTVDDLHTVVRDQLTDYVIESEDDLLPFVSILDGPRLMEAIADRGFDR
jgi:two-component system chemotaxis response regulator CheY